MVLQCAHRLCQTCYGEYLRTTPRAGCPCCRLIIQPSQVRKVTAFKKALPAPAPAQKAEDMAGESDIIADALDLDSINTLPETRYDRIREVEILGQWGAKVRDCALVPRGHKLILCRHKAGFPNQASQGKSKSCMYAEIPPDFRYLSHSTGNVRSLVPSTL